MAFSPAQQEAILHTDGPALVLAGPGSGKTTVITHRVRQLIESGTVSGSNILVITFTRAAAAEMQQRFSSLTEGNLSGVTFGTFHSVYFRILRYAYNYDASNILTEKEQYAAISEIINQMSLDIEDEREFISGLLGEISAVKSNNISLDHYYSKNCPEQTFRQIYTRYEKKLEQMRRVDFDDILLLTLRLLTDRPDICQAWQQKFRYILIDEFQDINYVQYQVIRLLAAPLNNLFIVGDDDQSIYRFRGARPEIMLGFEKDYPNARRILLDINFRSDACIVRTACRLISHNRARFDKEIIASHPADHPVSLSSCKDIASQNHKLVQKILSHHEQGRAYREMAILFRTNLGGRFITDALMKANIPFVMRDTLPNMYEHWIAQDLLSYLRIASGSRARALWLRIINRPNRYISRDAFPAFSDITVENLRPYYKDKEWMQERLDRLSYDLSVMQKMTPYAAIHYIRKAMHYEDYLQSYAAERRMNLTELTEVLDSIHETTRTCNTLSEWESQINSYTQALKEQGRQENRPDDAVSLCTLHAAKGLEYPIVFMPDVNEDNIPHARAALDTDIEEERRLFYVGITRAKEQLYLFTVRERLNHQKAPSRFLQEMNKEAAVSEKAAASIRSAADSSIEQLKQSSASLKAGISHRIQKNNRGRKA